MPTVSVVISAFTMQRFEPLTEAIRSVQEQSVAAHEVILVVDYSPELLEVATSTWPEIRVVANSEPRGLSGARNTGVAASTGEVVAFLDDDARADRHWLELLARSFDDPQVLGVGGPVRPRWEVGRPRWFPPEFDWIVGCTHSAMPSSPAPVRNPVGANMGFRRELLIAAGGFRDEMGRLGDKPIGGEETDMAIRVARIRRGGIIRFDPGIAVDHLVPAVRSRFRYFASRSWHEGRSKAVLSRILGAEPSLREERDYVRRALPLGIARGIRDTASGDPAGLARAGAIAAGLAITGLGYLVGTVATRRSGEGLAGERREHLRVLMVTPRSPLGQGGVERHVAEVSRRLVQSGAEVEVLCADPEGKSPPVTMDGVKVTTVKAWPSGKDYYLAPSIWSRIQRDRWDILHVQSYHTLVAPLAMLRAIWLGLPFVLTFHGGGHSSDLRNRLRSAHRRVLRPLLAQAKRLVAVARFEIDAYSRELRLPRDRFALIPNGVDIGPAPGNGGPSPGQPGLIATIGRLERYKGHHRVIAAMPHVLEHREDARLLVVGAGPYEKDLRSQVAALGLTDQVDFISIPPDDRRGMAQLLGRTSLVVLLSDFETHPLTALEAAAAGRRLLVAEGSGLGEIADDGLARKVPADTAPAVIAAAIAEELALPPHEGPVNVSTWDDCAAALLELYRDVASRA